jgi:hypothetical protein
LGPNWARAGVINFDSTRFAAHEIPPDKARSTSRADDHEKQMTSLVILVISLFE